MQLTEQAVRTNKQGGEDASPRREDQIPFHLLGRYPVLAKSMQNHGTADRETAYRAERHYLGNLRSQT